MTPIEFDAEQLECFSKLKTRGHFLSNDAAIKFIRLALCNITAEQLVFCIHRKRVPQLNTTFRRQRHERRKCFRMKQLRTMCL